MTRWRRNLKYPQVMKKRMKTSGDEASDTEDLQDQVGIDEEEQE